MVTRANVEATKAFIRARLGNPYVYGGALSENVRQGTDCSEVWQTVLEMVHGRWVQGRQSEGATTESYRYIDVGQVGPFGTIRVAHWRDIPADAAARIAFHHGPGGGANSHMWGELDGMRIESGGSKGLQTGDRAMAVESSYATAWAYLPGPIGGVGSLGIGSTGPAVIALQHKLNERGAGLDVDGDYGNLTASAVTRAQQELHVVGDPPGVAGEATQRALGLLGADGAIPAQPNVLAAEYLAQATGLSVTKAQQILPTMQSGLKLADATNVNRIAMFYAQTGHESANFNATEEYASGAAYEGRADLGNTHAGDGVRFKGRTWIQITGRHNYGEFSKWAYAKGLVPDPNYFLDHPQELSDIKWAGIGAAWYWTVARTDINELSDRRDLDTVTRRINGGLNGIDERRTRYNRALGMGDKLLTIFANEPEDEWEALMADQTRYPSRAWYRSDDVPAHTPLDLLRNIDGMKWDERVTQAAFRGEVWAIETIAKVAKGEGPEKSPAAIEESKNLVRQLKAALAAQIGDSK
ncbi:lysin A [Mycobacterium phage Jeeves]|uniref:Lysin A n=1 Tax=Mycobacterium phage Jeeves TaxID=2652402 RepID=A0A5J6T2E0_9CAUD|nr:endolysin [Mycobacterium phage Jeeves]QFG04484.1 lysin A [Mycobacterium phage Jeeves]